MSQLSLLLKIWGFLQDLIELEPFMKVLQLILQLLILVLKDGGLARLGLRKNLVIQVLKQKHQLLQNEEFIAELKIPGINFVAGHTYVLETSAVKELPYLDFGTKDWKTSEESWRPKINLTIQQSLFLVHNLYLFPSEFRLYV